MHVSNHSEKPPELTQKDLGIKKPFQILNSALSASVPFYLSP